MARIMGWRIILGLAASGFLAACVETSGTTEGGTAGATGGSTKVRAGAEVEAPEVFQATDSALWDGRPSLGGIWVASPDAVDPERVVMFNPATGKTVKGALFRRERDNPGPRLQLSSDAAEALGVLAGMPTEIQVTALRKEEVVEEIVPEAVAPIEADSVAAEAEPADGAEAGADAATVAAAALDAVDAGAGAGAEAASAADPAAAAVTAEDPPKRKTWKEKRAEAKAAREAKKAAAAAAEAAAGEAPVAEGAEAPTAETAGVAAIESAPLDARKPEVAAGNDPAPKPAKAAAADEAVPAPAEPAPVEAGGATRTIQIASFSKEDNANRAVEALSKIGIAARVQKLEKDGKAVWGVVATGDQATLNKIKDAGFADAYFLK